MKKVALILGLVTGIVTNAQFVMGTVDGVVTSARVTSDNRVYVRTHRFGDVLTADTLNELPANFKYSQGYKQLSAPQISDPHHEHKHEPKSELKEYWKRITTPGNPDYNEFWGIISVVGACLVFDWAYEPTKINWTPSGFNNIPSGGGVSPIGGGRCSAIATSTGQRCKRNSESGRAYCWQH